MNKLEVRNLVKTYNDFSLNLSFSMYAGEFISIIGPSGCGKTTLLQLIAGFIKADEGEIYIDDIQIDNLKINKRNLSYVFQNFSLFDHLNVEKNISYSKSMRKMRKKERRALVDKYLNLIGLEDFNKRSIDSLSGGQKQRVAIARALASKANILLLDEPFSNLDENLRCKLRNVLKDIHRKTDMSIIYVTHDQSEALNLSDRILLLNNGRLEAFDKPKKLYANPPTLFCASFLGDLNIINGSLLDENEYNLCFRYEKVVISNGKIMPEFLPHYILNDALLIDEEYHGRYYIYTFSFRNTHIKALSYRKVNQGTLNLGIRYKDVIKFNKSTGN